ncbi:MAG: hypothetical protein ACJA09_003343 [Alcanivorax sp.]|jgi:hypothetical protein
MQVGSHSDITLAALMPVAATDQPTIFEGQTEGIGKLTFGDSLNPEKLGTKNWGQTTVSLVRSCHTSRKTVVCLRLFLSPVVFPTSSFLPASLFANAYRARDRQLRRPRKS